MKCKICDAINGKFSNCSSCHQKLSNSCPKCGKESFKICDTPKSIFEEIEEKIPKRWDVTSKEWLPAETIKRSGGKIDEILHCGAKQIISPCIYCGEELFNHCPDCGHFEGKNRRFQCSICKWQLITCPNCIKKYNGLGKEFNDRFKISDIDTTGRIICPNCKTAKMIKEI